VQKTLLLERLPHLGRVVPEFEDERIRELPMYSYRVLYEIKPSYVDILAVIHKRRDLANAEELLK
jgi:plasmid stabilization system protein ParE